MDFFHQSLFLLFKERVEDFSLVKGYKLRATKNLNILTKILNDSIIGR